MPCAYIRNNAAPTLRRRFMSRSSFHLDGAFRWAMLPATRKTKFLSDRHRLNQRRVAQLEVPFAGCSVPLPGA